MAAQSLNRAELRVLGCLIEKQRTTPEQYPLTLNALRLACNQSTNRDPVLELDETEVRTAAQSLGTYGYARLATGPGSRTAKYRQLFGEALDLLPSEVSILGVLMLRGPQTVSELKTRTERLYHFASSDDVAATLARLEGKELVEQLGKRPGQREERWGHLLEGDPRPAEPGEFVAAAEPSALDERLARIEARLSALENRVRDSRPKTGV